jgi:acetylornithine deacetylase/succinyl-diaminopimelate desuccinylase-like protein
VTKGATGLAVVLTVLLIGLLAADGHAASSNGGAAAAERSRQAIAADARVQAALTQIKKDDATTLREQMAIAQIPSPPFKEAVRAGDYLSRLRALGLSDAAIDPEGNVVARRKGAVGGPTLVLSAHLDTVFPEGTDVKVRQKDGRYHGPGFVDDSRGLAVLLTVLRAMQANAISTSGDVLFVGTVGEEGLGNLRGVKALLRDHKNIDGFISVDSVSLPDEEHGRSKIVSQATGSRRWSATFTTTGGHSFNNFGLPSAIHAMGRAIAKIDELRPPADPKTTFTVGVVSGGTSVNAIAGEAQMQVDIRSNSAVELARLEKQILAVIDQAVVEENARWNSKDTKVQTRLLGDRPAGTARNDTPVVQAALQAAVALKLPEPLMSAASTDSNVALSMGIPAATLSGGGRGDKFHSLEEWYEPMNSWLGPQAVLLTVLALVGVEGVSAPLLQHAGSNH